MKNSCYSFTKTKYLTRPHSQAINFSLTIRDLVFKLYKNEKNVSIRIFFVGCQKYPLNQKNYTVSVFCEYISVEPMREKDIVTFGEKLRKYT